MDKHSNPTTMTEKIKNVSAHVSLWRRLAAITYDFFLLFAVLFFASLIVIVPFKITLEDTRYPLYIAYVYSVSFVFFGWFWTHGSQTLGMKTWHIKIKTFDGKTITWRQAFVRFIVALLSIILLGAGFIWCLFNRESLSWHDLVSKTRLVRY